MTASNVTGLLFQRLSYTGEREKVISSNIANINTPNYKTKDLSFQNHINKVKYEHDLQLVRTNSNHISTNNFDQPSKPLQNQIYEVQGLEEQNDGNNVNMDQQISEMSKNAIMYNALTTAIKKDAQWFKSVIDASSKN